MALHKLKDFDPDYQSSFNKQDVVGFDLYSGSEKIGSVDDLLVDDEGRFRYLVINTGFWVAGKKVLLPIGRATIAFNEHRVYANGLSRDQVKNLPQYNESDLLDYDYEESVRNIYRPTVPTASNKVDSVAPNYDRNSYTYQQDASLYGLDEQNHKELRLYEERLVANKTRQKVGEVAVSKRVETEVATATVPVEKERIVIETTQAGAETVVTPGEDAFREGEVARVEVYEETPDVHKEAVVREEVNLRKEVSRETVDAEEQLRRERLDVTTTGHPNLDKSPNSLPDDRL